MRTPHPITLLLAALFALSAVRPAATPAPPAYLEPGLSAAGGQLRSVIVSAASTSQGAAAVQRLGGSVTSRLDLINAVAAVLPASRIEALATTPGVTSVVANKGIASADAGGWMSQVRVLKASVTLAETVHNPVAYLSDGSYVVVGEKGEILIVKPDGSQRARFRLPNGPFKSPTVVVNSDDTIYVASESKSIYALHPDGTLRWHFRDANGAKFLAGLAVTTGLVFAADDKGVLYAIDAASGARRWTYSAGETVLTAPIVGPDGVLFVVTEKGKVHAVRQDGGKVWSANLALPVALGPQLSPDGQKLIVASTDGKRVVALSTANGSTAYSFATASKILAAPALAPDGSLFVATEDRALYGLEPDGRQRFLFRPTSGKFKTSPVLSADGATVYVAIEEQTLFAVDTQLGAERWRYTTLGRIQASPELDVDGGVILGSEGQDLVRLSADGQVTFHTLVTDKLLQRPRSNRNGDTTVRVGNNQLLTIGRLPEYWDGRPDVQAAGSPKIWELVNPVAVDIGANELHNQLLPSGASNTGQGITVAVVDSGVYFDRDVKRELGTTVQKQYLGQADFVDAQCMAVTVSGRKTSPGTQAADHCYQTAEHSTDPYGHGTAVASVIWNNFTDQDTGAALGVAPGASVLSVRVLDENGAGSYERVIKGIEFVVNNRAAYNVRVLNLSLSAMATVPYFVDPLNRAVEKAWAAGIVVIVAAGNSGPGAESITVPGNDPYVITVGSVSSNRTPGYWADDYIPPWSAVGPTADGFLKPDILAPGANIVTFMYNGGSADAGTQHIVKLHPDYAATTSLFRMNGTSLSTAVTSGVAALMLQRNPALMPDQVKYRLTATARTAVNANEQLIYSPLQQGAGRLWAPDAVLGAPELSGQANQGMNLAADLAAGYATDAELAAHYRGPIQRQLSDDGQAYLYYVLTDGGEAIGVGASRSDTKSLIDWETLASGKMTWSVGKMTWSVNQGWDGGMSMAAGKMTWSVGKMTWSVGKMTWSVGKMTWSVSETWSAGADSSAAAMEGWTSSAGWPEDVISSTTWVADD